VPRLTGKIKGDEATYISMAFSVAKDRDLKYRPEDYRRFVAMYGTGPEGIFLKRTLNLNWRLRAGWPPVQITKSPVSSDVELDYGKPFAYAVAAAPFVAVFGLGGLLLFNILLLVLSAWCTVTFGRARTTPGWRADRTDLYRCISGSGLCRMVDAGDVQLYVDPWRVFSWLYKEVASPDASRWIRRPELDWVAAGSSVSPCSPSRCTGRSSRPLC
jgi:hypothetical protein